jgi:Etoposide-induced protein 2.4 (EI24)
MMAGRHVHPAGITALPLALRALLLGLKDGLRPRLAWSSLMWTIAVLAAWALAFALAPDAWWSLATVAGLLQAWAPWPATVAQVLAALVFGLSYVLLVIVSMALVILLVLMPRIRAICLRAYPGLQPASAGMALMGPWRNAVYLVSALLAGGLASLLLPVVGSLVLVALVSYFNVRGLLYDALDGLATPAEQEAVLHRQRPAILLLGLLLSALALVPVLGLLSPLIMGTSASHLAFAALSQWRGLSR